MKGLSILFTIALLAAAQLLAVQLRRARALPAQHSARGHAAPTTTRQRAARTPVPADVTFQL